MIEQAKEAEAKATEALAVAENTQIFACFEDLMQNTEALRVKLQGKTRGLSDKGLCAYLRGCYEFHNAIMQDAAQDLIDRYHAADKKKQPFKGRRPDDWAPASASEP